jgi:hypothetical protein
MIAKNGQLSHVLKHVHFVNRISTYFELNINSVYQKFGIMEIFFFLLSFSKITGQVNFIFLKHTYVFQQFAFFGLFRICAMSYCVTCGVSRYHFIRFL